LQLDDYGLGQNSYFLANFPKLFEDSSKIEKGTVSLKYKEECSAFMLVSIVTQIKYFVRKKICTKSYKASQLDSSPLNTIKPSYKESKPNQIYCYIFTIWHSFG